MFEEKDYEGYGEFGGKDIYELIAEMNGKKTREEGIDLCDVNNLEFEDSAKASLKIPKLVQVLPTFESNEKYKEWWNRLPYPKTCKYQGYFY